MYQLITDYTKKNKKTEKQKNKNWGREAKTHANMKISSENN